MAKEGIGASIRDLVAENVAIIEEDERYRRNCAADLRRLTVAAKALPGREVLTQVVELVQKEGRHSALLAGAYFRTAVRLEEEGMVQEAIFFYRLSHYLVPNPMVPDRLALICSEGERDAEGGRDAKAAAAERTRGSEAHDALP